MSFVFNDFLDKLWFIICVYILDVSIMMLILMGNDCYSKNDVILLYLFCILSIGKKLEK